MVLDCMALKININPQTSIIKNNNTRAPKINGLISGFTKKNRFFMIPPASAEISACAMVNDFDTVGALRRLLYFSKISPQWIHSTFWAGCSKLHFGHIIVFIESPLIF
jgi:hypothetical protein